MMYKGVIPGKEPEYMSRFAVDITHLGITATEWVNMLNNEYCQSIFEHGGFAVISHDPRPLETIEAYATIDPAYIVGHVKFKPLLIVDAGVMYHGHQVAVNASPVDVYWLPRWSSSTTEQVYRDDAEFPGCHHLVPRLVGNQRIICFDLITTKLPHLKRKHPCGELAEVNIDPELRGRILKMSDEEIYEIMNMSPEEALKETGYNQCTFSFWAGYIRGEKDNKSQE